MLSKEIESSSPLLFSISFVTQKGSSNGWSALVRLPVLKTVESETVEF